MEFTKSSFFLSMPRLYLEPAKIICSSVKLLVSIIWGLSNKISDLRCLATTLILKESERRQSASLCCCNIVNFDGSNPIVSATTLICIAINPTDVEFDDVLLPFIVSIINCRNCKTPADLSLSGIPPTSDTATPANSKTGILSSLATLIMKFL